MSRRIAAGWRAVCLVNAAALAALTAAVLSWGLLPGEVALYEALLDWTSPVVNETAGWAAEAGTWRVLLPAMLILLSLSREARRRWWLWGGILVAAPAIESGWKLLVGRLRPESPAFGFPSGHATAAAAFAVMVIYLVGRARLAGMYQWLARVLASGVMVAVGLARVMLGAHWPGDVIAGLALGTACAAAGAWWDAAHPPSDVEPSSRG